MVDKRVKRVYVVGLDGMMLPMYERFAAEGVLPHLKHLADTGVVTQAYNSLPAWTPTNWATLMTGAHTGTHTVSRWFLNMPTPRKAERTLSAFVSPAVAAETVFEAADKAGLKSVAIRYPAAAPSRATLAHTVGYGRPAYGVTPFEITPSAGYTNLEGLEKAYQVELRQAEGWRNLPISHSPALEFPIRIITKREGETQTLMGLAVDTHGRGYDTVVICTSCDGDTEIARSAVGQWSDWIHRTFVVEGKQKEGTLRFKTIELSPDASRLRLYRSQVSTVDDFCEPAELGSELVQRFGPWLGHASFLSYVWGTTDFHTCMEELEYQCQWNARAGKYLLEEKDYSLFYTQVHLFDWANHKFVAWVDPASPGYDPAKADEGWQVFRELYRIADRMLEVLMQEAPEDTAFLVVSDHGIFPQHHETDVYRLLCDKGYLVLKNQSKRFDPNNDYDNIDLERSKVFVTPVRSFELFINAPEDSEEYERIQHEVLTLLRTWVDRETGRCPIAVALPKRHAALLGFWGEQCGDIVFFFADGYVSGYPSGEDRGGDPYVWKPQHYEGHHGPYLPTARTEVSSNMAFLLASGPGLKRGYDRPVDRLGYVHLTSVVPIVCHLLGIDVPGECQGALPQDFLESTRPVMERPRDLPDWEWGTRVEGWGDRVWAQKRSMFDGFMGKAADPRDDNV